MPSDFLNWDLMIWYTTIVQFDGEILKFYPGYRSFTCDEIFDLNYFIKQTVVVCGYWYVWDTATLSEYFKLSTGEHPQYSISAATWSTFNCAFTIRSKYGVLGAVDCWVARTEQIVGSDLSHVTSILLFDWLIWACFKLYPLLFETAIWICTQMWLRMKYRWMCYLMRTTNTVGNVRAWVSRMVYIVWMWICVWPIYCDRVIVCSVLLKGAVWLVLGKYNDVSEHFLTFFLATFIHFWGKFNLGIL